ncbi:sensor histidine kinase [Mycolicibacterium vinylchloridicum]|uniref:sensor histidine kinase n=1 Tax=Mycolicibacterium vinylchloridicum TaxID=2736928 RepID=UPI0015C7249B|nr:ATP-binding protein [Mycolicibacterium vinylchloridicum]
MTSSVTTGSTSRRILRRGKGLCAVVRNSTNLIAAVAMLADPGTWGYGHRYLAAALACWALMRLVTRSPSRVLAVADWGWAAVVAAAIPMVNGCAGAGVATGAAQAIVTLTVATIVIELPARLSVPLWLSLTAIYAIAEASATNWLGPFVSDDLYGVTVVTLTAFLIRRARLQLTTAMDIARQQRISAQLFTTVAAERLAAEREQLATLHDTAAATLLLATEVDEPAREQLAAQAARDLTILQHPLYRPLRRVDVVAALHSAACHVTIPVRFIGRRHLWLRGGLASAVQSAVREAFNNVERHADACEIVVEVEGTRIVVHDDGIGMAADQGRYGYGLSESIIGRMRRAGGTAAISSGPGRGTAVELTWIDDAEEPEPDEPADGSGGLIDRIRVVFGLAATGYAVVNVIAAAPWSIAHGAHPRVEWLLASIAIICALAAIPGIVWHRWGFSQVAVVVLAFVALAQPALLSGSQLHTEIHWAASAVGFCLIPQLMRCSPSRAITIVALFWLIPAAVDLLRVPSTSMVVAIACGLANFLVPQIALTFCTSIIEQDVRDVHAENRIRDQLMIDGEVARAVRDDYETRHAGTVERLLPVLTELSSGRPLTPELRSQARTENQRLRHLFDAARGGTPPRLESIRAVVNAATGRGLDVTAHIDAQTANVSARDANALLATIGEALAHARSYARVVVTTAESKLTGSVVCDVADEDFDLVCVGAGVDVIASADTRWITCEVPCSEQPA